MMVLQCLLVLVRMIMTEHEDETCNTRDLKNYRILDAVLRKCDKISSLFYNVVSVLPFVTCYKAAVPSPFVAIRDIQYAYVVRWAFCLLDWRPENDILLMGSLGLIIFSIVLQLTAIELRYGITPSNYQSVSPLDTHRSVVRSNE